MRKRPLSYIFSLFFSHLFFFIILLFFFLQDIMNTNFYNCPTEIIHSILSYLTSKDKGVCQLVCHSWKSFSVASQYRKVQIKGKKQFVLFYSTLNSVESLGKHIKHLSVDGVDLDTHHVRFLQIVCPYLVEFAFQGKPEMNTCQDTMLSSWKHLRRITNTNHSVMTTNESTILTHLSVCLKLDDSLKTIFLHQLTYSRDLVELSIDSVTLSVLDFESIHRACPKLVTLLLSNAILLPIGDTAEEKRAVAHDHYTQARYLKKFHLNNTSDLDQDYEWLYYFAQKYKNLTELHLWNKYTTDAPETSPTTEELEERYKAMAAIGLSCTQLLSLKLFNISANHWFFDAMDKAGTRLNSIALGDMTENTLDLLHCLRTSNQQVTSLTLYGWPSLCIEDVLKEVLTVIGGCSNQLFSFALSMCFSGIRNSPVSVDLILKHCPSLISLDLDYVQAVMRQEEEKMKNKGGGVKSPLTRFGLINGSFRNDLFTQLSKRCPDLVTLKMESCSFIGNHSKETEVKIDMPYHVFESIHLNHIRPWAQLHCSQQAQDIQLYKLNTSIKHNQVYELTGYESYQSCAVFDYEQKQLEYKRPTKYVQHKDLTSHKKLFVSIHCHYLKELIISDFWII